MPFNFEEFDFSGIDPKDKELVDNGIETMLRDYVVSTESLMRLIDNQISQTLKGVTEQRKKEKYQDQPELHKLSTGTLNFMVVRFIRTYLDGISTRAGEVLKSLHPGVPDDYLETIAERVDRDAKELLEKVIKENPHDEE